MTHGSGWLHMDGSRSAASLRTYDRKRAHQPDAT